MFTELNISPVKRASVDRTDQLPPSGLSDVCSSRFANGDQRSEESGRKSPRGKMELENVKVSGSVRAVAQLCIISELEE